MAAIANYKDKLLQNYAFDRVVPGNGIGDVEWPDVLDTDLLKPDDLATVGAEFDLNIPNTANTHNITSNAVSVYAFEETFVYLPGTETLWVDLLINPSGGNVILFISALFISNSLSTSDAGGSRAYLTIKYNDTTLISGVITNIQGQTNEAFVISLSEKFFHTPDDTSDTIFLITDKGAFLSPNNGDYLVGSKPNYTEVKYSIGLEYDSNANGTRGRLAHLSVYGLVLKR